MWNQSVSTKGVRREEWREPGAEEKFGNARLTIKTTNENGIMKHEESPVVPEPRQGPCELPDDDDDYDDIAMVFARTMEKKKILFISLFSVAYVCVCTVTMVG